MGSIGVTRRNNDGWRSVAGGRDFECDDALRHFDTSVINQRVKTDKGQSYSLRWYAKEKS